MQANTHPQAFTDQDFMAQAIGLATQAADIGEVPVGALVVCDGQIIGQGYNQTISAHDPCAHAEIMALRQAAQRIGNYRLSGCDLYVTLEPCTMCVGAIIHARIKRLVYAATEPKAGAVVSQLQLFSLPHFNHLVQVESGLMANEASAMLSSFFKQRRLAHKAAKAQQNILL
ncbi:MAG: tRNA adenosine(34) deaminase TadA [Gammaproteobacteria bacterium]|nr:tRNA adenosine(34) deaminase TadA [Gammaproteobacteria bacterium]